MTSFMIDQFVGRENGYSLDDKCRFCKIIQHKDPAYVIYEDAFVVAFLDTLPIRPGHTLLVPKAHHARLTDLPSELGGALGAGLIKIGGALTKGMDNPDLNFVCNQGYAQAVHHVHFHLVPAPLFNTEFDSKPATATAALSTIADEETLGPEATKTAPPSEPTALENKDIFKSERERRTELNGEDAMIIAERIRMSL